VRSRGDARFDARAGPNKPFPFAPASSAGSFRRRCTRPACTPAGGDATRDRCAADAGEERRVFGERVARVDRHLSLLELDPAAAGEPDHTPANGVDEPRHLTIRGRRQGNEPGSTGLVGDEDAIGDQAVKVNIEIEGGSRPLDRRDRTPRSATQAAPPGTSALQPEDGANEDRQDGSAETVVPGHGLAQASGAGEHPAGMSAPS